MKNEAVQQSQFPAASSVVSRRVCEVNSLRAMVFDEQADKMIIQGTSIIKSNLGEPDFGAPPAVRDATREQYDGWALPYIATIGLPKLRQAITDFYCKRRDLDIDPRRICVAAGGSAALLLTTALTVDPGDDATVIDPSYLCNRELVWSFEGRVIDVPTSAIIRFRLTADLCSQYWTNKTKTVMIMLPSNLTGITIDFNVLDEVCKLAVSRDTWRIVDETYFDLVDRESDDTEAKSVLTYDPDVIVCNDFSKSFGVTGWYLGWAILPDESIVLEAVDDLATNYYPYTHTPTQHTALACFTSEGLAECEARRQELLARRRIVIDGLKRIGLSIEVGPNGIFYTCLDISRTDLDAWIFCERVLDEAHMALTLDRDFGTATADTHMCLGYAASREALAEGLERLGAFVESL